MKKGQEEIAGFVLIIILVSIIALIFLGISIRKPAKLEGGRELENFLHSSMLFSISCDNLKEANLKELVLSCYRNEKCNEEYACDVLNKTEVELIENSFKTGEEAKYKGYKFRIYQENETLIQILRENPYSGIIGTEILVPAGELSLHIRLELLY